MSFARERDNDPLGYLLVGREGRQLAFVPLYVCHIRRLHFPQLADLNLKVPKTFSGTITVSPFLFPAHIDPGSNDLCYV